MTNSTVFTLFAFIFSGYCHAERLIQYNGSLIYANISNTLNLKATVDQYLWQNNEEFIKFRFEEKDIPAAQLNQLAQARALNSINMTTIPKPDSLRLNEKVLVVRELIADSNFLRFHLVDGQGATSFQLQLSLPERLFIKHEREIAYMFESVEWQLSELLTLSTSPCIKIENMRGFKITQKHENSLVLRSNNQHEYLNDVLLIISLLPHTSGKHNLEERSKSELMNSKSLVELNLLKTSNTTTESGENTKIFATAVMAKENTSIDLIQSSKVIANRVILTQLIAVKGLHSFLRLEEEIDKVIEYIYVDAPHFRP
ncbi:hypothetical protein [Planctobacterium marinum]|uniref:hypothetical protein n=1 Tax=Planctobacterium marinum TaxID=1631968 RepID=UPI001E629747|nr:hypothetical protein [Planctobacterium marinum]MCC2606112.1 hypothetical protein [Planctobacterium marinum]